MFKLKKEQTSQVTTVRKLRSSRTVFNVNKKKLKCHICRQKKDTAKLSICMNFKSCHHAFCHDCVNKSLHPKVKKEHLKPNETSWPCFTCRGLCKCSRCKQNLADELNFLTNCLSNKSIYDLTHLEADNHISLRSTSYQEGTGLSGM